LNFKKMEHSKSISRNVKISRFLKRAGFLGYFSKMAYLSSMIFFRQTRGDFFDIILIKISPMLLNSMLTSTRHEST